MENEQFYLYRCIQLARIAGNQAQPNPLVGALIVHQDRIIGEGYHAMAGGPHAEVMAISSVSDPSLLSSSRLYVSLEPCCFHGKTPPCVDLILEKGIPEVIIGCMDPNPKVSGKGIARLKAAGVKVRLAQNPKPFLQLIRYFQVNHQAKRPYIVLKWAESSDGFIAAFDADGKAQSTPISGFSTKILTHRLRAENQAIMVGRHTAQIDNPALTTRNFPGAHPLRIVWDTQQKLPQDLQLFQDGLPTLILGPERQGLGPSCFFLPIGENDSLSSVLTALYTQQNIASILIEGGSISLQHFLEADLWDEIYVYHNSQRLHKGVPAPKLPEGFLFDQIIRLQNDVLFYNRRPL